MCIAIVIWVIAILYVKEIYLSKPAEESDTDFLTLCTSGTEQEVRKAIKAGANVNAVI